ncbi:hypothetical protein M426DRAFT_26156 [Hypoxylon sp. CI-4A]|nr:hypothetical protein M426DRAFT_26156 [Hypoxylon sp. CI-4A]
MPIVDGKKMACVPCIRGHRSTKCNHGEDRVLVPVRKPGRPLSTCPHPPGKTCECRHVTAALPKGGICRCDGRPAKKVNGTPTLVKAEPPESSPVSPTKQQQPSFRIQKSAPKPARRQSDVSSLQRMDAGNFNFSNGADNNFLAASANAPAPPDWGSYLTPMQNGAHQYSTYPNITPTLDTTMNSSLLGINGSIMDLSSVPHAGNEISENSNGSSGTLTPGTSGSPYHTPTSSNGDSSQELPLEGTRSCCSQRAQQPSQIQQTPQVQPHIQPQLQPHMQFQGQPQAGLQESSNNIMGYATQISIGNGTISAQIPAQVATTQQLYAMNQFQPTAFPDNSSFGTPHYPLQQSQWEQLVANLLPQPGCGSSSFANGHECHCGSDCDCLGCLAHPYNQATTRYIHEVMAYQESNMDGKVDMNGSIPDPPLAVGETSPPPTTSPSDTESPSTNDLNLSPSEFLFVDYGSGMCGCGDDCACVNCMIHRDPIHNENQVRTPN